MRLTLSGIEISLNVTPGTYTVTKGNYILQTAYGGRATTQTNVELVLSAINSNATVNTYLYKATDSSITLWANATVGCIWELY